jgi:hypothetical protein
MRNIIVTSIREFVAAKTPCFDAKLELETLLNEVQAQLDQLQTDTQRQSIERKLNEVKEKARRLDAFVDDALYSGDAETARACAENALLIREQLREIESHL